MATIVPAFRQLERAPEKPGQAEKIREATDKLRGQNIGSVGDYYCTLRYKKKRLEARIKEINAELEATVQLLVGHLEAASLDKIRVPLGASLSINDKIYPSVADKHIWMGYIYENSMEHMLSVHPSTLKAYVTAEVQAGKAVPPGIKAFYKPTIRPWGLPKKLSILEEPEPELNDEDDEDSTNEE